VIGAGQTNMLMSNFLKKYKFHDVTVFNRTLEKAQLLADRLSGKAYTLEELNTYSNGFDIMIICTGSTAKFIDATIYKQLLQGDTDQKIIVDLSVPSNIDQEVFADNDINYIAIESLKKLAADNLAFRKSEISKVKEILAERVVEFREVYRQREIERDFSHLIEEMMSYMEKKCIAVPIKKAKQDQNV